MKDSQDWTGIPYTYESTLRPDQKPVAVTPEPATWIQLAMAILILAIAWRRLRRQKQEGR